jgi:predicted MFS family arabinose efflux permease
MASLGMSANVAMAVAPPVGMFLLTVMPAGSLFLAAGCAAAIGLAAMWRVPAPTVHGRPFRPVLRRSWIPPIAVLLCTIIPAAALMTFGPVEFDQAGVNPSLWFSAFGVAILVSRVPAAMLAERVALRPLLLASFLLGAAGTAILQVGYSAATLVASGVAIGLSTGICHPAMLTELSARSDEATRGTALSYFTASWGLGSIVGGVIGGLIIEAAGFQALLMAIAPLYIGAAVVAWYDTRWRSASQTSKEGRSGASPRQGAQGS